MLTAEQISRLTELPLHTVRYRLGELRRNGEIDGQWKQFGMTYAYDEPVSAKVLAYPEGQEE